MTNFLILLLLAISLPVIGCPGTAPKAEPAEASADTAVVTSTQLAAILGNLTYSGILPEQPVTLNDGIATYEDGSIGHPIVRLIDHLIIAGDLDGDGAEDAVAFLVDYTTGSADFVFLIAVLNVWDESRPADKG